MGSAPDGIVIRRAVREDAPALLELIQALARYERLQPPDETARERLVEHGWGDTPRFEAWLAEVNGRAVAYAIVFETYSTFLARPTLYLEDIFVLPEARRQGVGIRLFARIARLALERGCGRMEWACLHWNEPGLRFYERVGAVSLDEWRLFRLLPEQIAVLEQPDQ